MIRILISIMLLTTSTLSYAEDVTSFDEFPTAVERAGFTYKGILYDADDVAEIIAVKKDHNLSTAENIKLKIELTVLSDSYLHKEQILQDAIEDRNEVILRLEERAKRTWWEQHDGEVMLVAGAGIVTAIVVALNSDK